MSNKIISVIVPVYNTGFYLSKCVDSILAQSYKNLEVLLIDDGSELETANLCDVIAKIDSRIKVIHKANGGLSSARNTGIENAIGQYLAFVDSDDYISPTYYEELMNNISNDSVASSHYVRVDDEGNIVQREDIYLNNASIKSDEYVESVLLHKGDVSVCTKLFTRNIIGTTRFVEGKNNEDLLFMIEISKKIRSITFTRKVGYYYLHRSGSLSSGYGKSVIDMLENSKVMQREVLNHWPHLYAQAWRFVLYQHMAYLLLVPMTEIKSNLVYKSARNLIRTSFFKLVIPNKYLSVKQKLIMFSLILMPKKTACLFQKKNGYLKSK